MAFDPDFDSTRQQLAPNVRVSVQLSTREYEDAIAVLVNEIIKYFTDDAFFTVRTPMGPDAMIHVTASKINRQGVVLPGYVSIDTIGAYEWEDNQEYARWRYLAYDMVLDMLHGNSGEKPLSKAKELISKIKTMKKDVSPETTSTIKTTGISDESKKSTQGIQLVDNNGGIPFAMFLPPRRGTTTLSVADAAINPVEMQHSASAGPMAIEYLDFIRQNPTAGPREIAEWFQKKADAQEQSATPMSGLTLRDLFSAEDLDDDGSPTEAVCSEWPISVACSESFQERAGTFKTISATELATLLTQEVRALPLKDGDTDVEWIVEQILIYDDDIAKTVLVDLTEFVAVTVPKAGNNYQYYWSSQEELILVRKCPSPSAE